MIIILGQNSVAQRCQVTHQKPYNWRKVEQKDGGETGEESACLASTRTCGTREKKKEKPSVVVHDYIPSSGEAEGGRFLKLTSQLA